MSDPAIVSVFSQPQLGGDLPYFKGKQYGKGGFLKEIERVGYPILLQAGKTLGRVAMNTLDDVLGKKKNFTESLRNNAVSEFMDVISQKRKQSGSGMNKRKKRKKAKYTIFDD